MSWWRASFEVPAELADAAAWLLAEALDTPVEVQDATTMDKSDAADVHRVVVSFADAPPEDLQARVDACLAELGLAASAVQTQRHDEDTWKEGWKAFFRGQRLSARLAVRPPWEVDDPEAPVTVIIDPGMAFGTGTHETTRGVMRALDAHLPAAPTTLLDVGCGSAILSIAAARLGHRAVGVEIDPVAVDNARHNLRLNGVGDRVELHVGSADAVAGRFPVVVANILAHILVELAPLIVERTGDVLVLSGMLHGQVDAVRAAYAALDEVERLEEGPWTVLVLRRR
jgi:ribosomal protein L11 methyltransferase